MSLTKDFVANIVSNRLVFTEQDYVNFMNICNKKADIVEFKKLKSEISNYNYKVSNSFFGKEFIHPNEVNPYRINYNLTDIMNEMKLKNQKINADDKLTKIINYLQISI